MECVPGPSTAITAAISTTAATAATAATADTTAATTRTTREQCEHLCRCFGGWQLRGNDDWNFFMDTMVT